MLFKGNGLEADPDRKFFWLRPETVESYFYPWRITKDQKYRDWAWDVAVAIEKECRCGSGCGNFDIIFDHLSHAFPSSTMTCIPPHTPCDVPYFVPMLIAC